MSDIVERLHSTIDHSAVRLIMFEAADEIERLRAEVLRAEARAERAEEEVRKWQNIFRQGTEALAQKEPSDAQNTGTE